MEFTLNETVGEKFRNQVFMSEKAIRIFFSNSDPGKSEVEKDQTKVKSQTCCDGHKIFICEVFCFFCLIS